MMTPHQGSKALTTTARRARGSRSRAVRWSSQVEPLGHCSGGAATNPSATSCDSNRGGTGVNPKRRDAFDPQQTVTGQRPDHLVSIAP